jgi:hypothetical protein
VTRWRQPDERSPPVSRIALALEQALALEMANDLADHRLRPAQVRRGLSDGERPGHRQVLEHRARRARQLAARAVAPVKREVDGPECLGEPLGPRPVLVHGTSVAAALPIVNPDGIRGKIFWLGVDLGSRRSTRGQEQAAVEITTLDRVRPPSRRRARSGRSKSMRFLGYTLGDPTQPLPPPTPELMEQMGKLTEDATKAGVLLATGGMAPYEEATKVIRSGGKITVVDGPFTEAKELVGGWALMECRDKDEAIEWTKRFLEIAGDGESMVRQVY